MNITKTFCVKIKEGLYLNGDVLDFEREAIEQAKAPINYLFVIDRSGSMSSTIEDVWDDVLAHIRTIPTGNTITLAWFSSEGGNHGVILKGYKITGPDDYQVIESTVAKYRGTVALTCFSEILEELDSTVDDLAAISQNFALLFFTDGYPVVSNYKAEEERILAACQQVGSRLSAAMFVGYSHYYNRELLQQMAGAIGGSLVHSKDLPAFSNAQGIFLQTAQNARLKELVNVPEPNIYAPFSVDTGQIVTYLIKSGQIGYAPKDGVNMVFYFSDKVSNAPGAVLMTVDSVLTDPSFIETEEGKLVAQALYSAAAGLNQTGNTLAAIDLLGAIGDKRLIDSVVNAFTNDEAGVVEYEILRAAADPALRFTEGRDTNYVPADDAVCLVDLMDWLMDDEDAFFYPRHEAFVYERTGVASHMAEGSLKFNADDNAKCAFNTLTWHKSKLNLSVLAAIKGAVDLPDADAKREGLPNPFPSVIYRNYMIVKDGHTHTIALPVSLGEDTFKRVQELSLIDGSQKWEKDKIYLLRLEGLPVMNRAMANGATDIETISKLAAKELQLQAAMKVLKAKRDELDPEGAFKSEPSPWSAEQETYLESVGIKKSVFSPKTEKAEPVDFYDVRTFEVAIAGCSSLPKVSDVESKLSSGKGLNTPAELMAAALLKLKPVLDQSSVEDKLRFIDGEIGSAKTELATTRKQLQRVKFAILLAKRWFDGYNPREQTQVTLQDVVEGTKGKLPLTFTYKLDEERVPY